MWEIQKSDGLITAKKLMVWLNAKTNRRYPYKESFWTFLEALMYLIGFLGVFSVVYFKFNKIILSPRLWLVGVYVIFFISIAGVIFNILNNTPWTGRESDGKEKFAAPSSRSQYIKEGLVMSGSILLISILLILFTLIPKFTSNS